MQLGVSAPNIILNADCVSGKEGFKSFEKHQSRHQIRNRGDIAELLIFLDYLPLAI